MMQKELIKKSVVESYGKLAKASQYNFLGKLFACCNLTENADLVAEQIGYSKETLNRIPEGSNLGVGCGNPSVFIDIKNGDSVLDLGSGAGFDAFVVSPLVGPTGKVIGLDLSDDMIQLAKKNAKKTKIENVEFLKGDIEDIPLKDNMVDHVISNCVINLSLDKAAVYQESYRVLKEGGSLSISDIILEKELPDFIKNSLAGHIACVSGSETLDQYLSYIEDAGFKNIKVEKKTNFPLELMLADPQVMQIAKEMNFNLNSEEAKDIASRVMSVSITAEK